MHTYLWISMIIYFLLMLIWTEKTVLNFLIKAFLLGMGVWSVVLLFGRW
jgi:hypothetical protein